MKDILKFIRYFFVFSKYSLKTKLSYSKDFKIGLVVTLFTSAIQILTIKIMFQNFDKIANWGQNEMILLYSVYSLNTDVFSLIFGNLRSLKRYIFSGELEDILVKPLDSISLILLRDISLIPIIGIFIDIIIFVYAFTSLGMEFDFALFSKLSIYSICGILVYFSLLLLGQCILFYTNYYYTPYDSVVELFEINKYPISILPKAVQFIFERILPISLVGPGASSILLNNKSQDFSIYPVITTILILILSLYVFKKSISKYDGVGT